MEWSNRGPKFFRRHVGGHFGSQCIALRGRHCIARQALHLHCHQHHVTGCGNIVELCERQSIMMPTDAYRSNFFAVKFFCLLVSISSSPLSPFAHETLMLDNQCCHCSSSSSTRWRWCMLALMTDDCRSSSYGVNEHLHHLTHFYLQSISLFGTDLSPMLANEHGDTTRLQRHDHFLHYFHILKICTDNIMNRIHIIK